MTFLPCLNCVEAEMRYLWDGQRVENRLNFHWEGPDDVTVSNMDALGATLIAAWEDGLRGSQTTT